MGDTNEISKGCLTHYDNRHIQVRHDFLGLCAYDKAQFKDRRKEEPNQECMAKIMRLIETLTDHAKTDWQLKALKARDKGLTVPQEPKEYPIELTNGVIVTLMYNTFGESTVRNSLDYLVHVGYIGRRQEKRNSTPLYWLCLTKIQALLKEQAEQELSGFENTPSNIQGLKIHPKRPKSNPKPTISNPDPPKLDPSGFESTDNNNSNIDNITEKDKKDSFASPIVDAEPSDFSDDDEPTVKAPAIPKTPIISTPAQDIPPAVEAVPEQAALGNENETQYPQQQTLVAPAASKPRARQARKAVEPEPTPDELALQVRCKTWYDRLTEWCGGPMTRGGQVINEHRSIKLACQKYSDGQLEAIFKYVTTRDWKYSKIDNKYTVRCYVLWDESGRVAQILKEERQGKSKASPAVAAGYTDYTNAAPINYRPLRMPGDRKRVLV